MPNRNAQDTILRSLRHREASLRFPRLRAAAARVAGPAPALAAILAAVVLAALLASPLAGCSAREGGPAPEADVDHKSLLAKGDAAYDVHQYENARQLYQEAARSGDPLVRSRALTGQGRVSTKLDEPDRAVEFCRRGLALVESPKGRFYLGQAYLLRYSRTDDPADREAAVQAFIDYLRDPDEDNHAINYARGAVIGMGGDCPPPPALGE